MFVSLFCILFVIYVMSVIGLGGECIEEQLQVLWSMVSS